MAFDSEAPGFPGITIIIPSISAPTLRNTLKSILANLADYDSVRHQILVVGDGPQFRAETMVREMGEPFRYVEGPQTRQWGNAQRNFGITLAEGDYISWMDEDDQYAPGAFLSIRQRVIETPGRPLLFRFKHFGGDVVWYETDSPKARLEMGRIGGHCAVFPNVPEKLGRWGDHYCGDFDFIKSSLSLYPEDLVDAPVWCPEVIALSRPAITKESSK